VIAVCAQPTACSIYYFSYDVAYKVPVSIHWGRGSAPVVPPAASLHAWWHASDSRVARAAGGLCSLLVPDLSMSRPGEEQRAACACPLPTVHAAIHSGKGTPAPPGNPAESANLVHAPAGDSSPPTLLPLLLHLCTAGQARLALGARRRQVLQQAQLPLVSEAPRSRCLTAWLDAQG